jgi:outer membrane biosynthesis protein TonB
MRNELRTVGLLGVILMAISAHGQTTPSAAVPAVPILQRGALPVYPPIAKAARETGKVTVRVPVKDGLVVQTDVLSKPDIASGQRFLETATVENLKTDSGGDRRNVTLASTIILSS